MSATTFHPFPRLPKELRLEIWKLLIPEARIVQFRLKHVRKDWMMPILKWVAQSEPFTQCLRDVNSEAREVFRSSYHAIDVPDESNGPSASLVDVDYQRDAFYFATAYPDKPNYDSLGFSPEIQDGTATGMEKAKIVVLDLNIMENPFYRSLMMHPGFEIMCFDPRQRAMDVIEDVMAVFPQLEKLYFIVDPQCSAPRRMIDPFDSKEYNRWYMLHRSQVIHWIPDVTAQLNANLGTRKQISLQLKLFVPKGEVNKPNK